MRVVRLYKLEDGGGVGPLMYQGDIEGLPPGPARDYWEAIKEHYGDLAWEYFLAKSPPLSLIYQGFTLEPLLDEGDEDWEDLD